MGRNIIDGVPYHIENIDHYVGKMIGQSDWFPVEQDRVDAFGRATEDFNPIHVNPEWAAEHGPFGGAVAHGFFTLSMLSHLGWAAGLQPDGVDYGLNLGFDRVRFLAPVLVGDEIRMRVTLLEYMTRGEGRWQLKNRVVLETRKTEKAALNAIWLTMIVRDPEGGAVLAYAGGNPNEKTPAETSS